MLSLDIRTRTRKKMGKSDGLASGQTERLDIRTRIRKKMGLAFGQTDGHATEL